MRADKETLEAPKPPNSKIIMILTVGAILITIILVGGAFIGGMILFPYVPPSTPTPTPIIIYITTTPTPSDVMPEPTIAPTPYPTLSPTVTPNRDDAESISILDPGDYDRVVSPEPSISTGSLTITGKSYYGSAYAYRGDTFLMRINYQAVKATNQVQVRYSAISLDGNTSLIDTNKIEYWRLEPADTITRNYGFHINNDPEKGIIPHAGTYTIRLNVYNYNQTTDGYDDYCAGFIRKITIL